MSNLTYCSPQLRQKVEEFLGNPSVRDSVRHAVRIGLERDCVDAARDAETVAAILGDVCDDLQRARA